MFLLTTFNLLILVLLIGYVLFRLLKTKGILSLILFTLQLSALTIVFLSLVNGVETTTAIELFYLTFGIVCPCCFIAYDYRMMIKKVKEKGSYDGFIQINKKPDKAVENTLDVMGIVSNDIAESDTLIELGLLKEDLFKGVKKKILQAESYYKENNLDYAYDIYNNLLEIFNTSSNLHFNYANICYKKGLFNEALSYYRKVLELNEQLLNKLKHASSSQNSHTDEIKSIEGKEYLVYYNIGVIYFNMNKIDFACDNFKKALEINPSFVNAKEGIGRTLVFNGELVEAARCYEEILQKDTNNYVASLLLGKTNADMKNYSKAEESFRKCIKLNSDRAEAFIEMGKVLMLQEKYNDAIKNLRNYIILMDGDYNGHYNLANCYFQTKAYNKAIYEYERAINLNPDSYNSMYNIALIFDEIQEYEKAINYYQKALMLKIDFVDAYNNLGILLSKQLKHAEALATYSNGIKSCPNNFRLYYNMGVVLYDLRRYEEARVAFEKAVEINPKDNEVYYYLGASLTELKKYEDAIKAYSKAISENISEGEIYYNIAAVYALMKNNAVAVENLKKAISLNPDIKENAYKNNVFENIYSQLAEEYNDDERISV